MGARPESRQNKISGKTKQSVALLNSENGTVKTSTKSSEMPNTSEDTSEQTQNMNEMSADDLRVKLQELKLPISGSKAVLASRLNKALTSTNDDGNGETDELKSLSVKELRSRLARLGLRVTGKKAELHERLQTALNGEIEDEDDEEEDDDEQAVSVNQASGQAAHERGDEQQSKQRVGSSLTFKDVEDALEMFSADKGENINRWLASFEGTADVCAWSDIQRLMFAKKLLRGSAKLFANFECAAKSWLELKDALVEEFAKTINSKQVHAQLSSVKKRNDETYQAYVYRVLAIASHADMEQEAKIQYVVDGIADDGVNKSMLYSARSIKELREKLTIYETQKYTRQRPTEERLALTNRRI